MKENKKNVVTGLSAAAGSLAGSLGAEAAENHMNHTEQAGDDEVVVIEVYPDPDFIVEDVYAGPDPDVGLVETDPMEVVYGPPEPDVYPDFEPDDF